jgi:hypothetical protein
VVIYVVTLYSILQTETLGRPPSAAELFAATHSKVDESGNRIWCDSYAAGVYVSNYITTSVVGYIVYETRNYL